MKIQAAALPLLLINVFAYLAQINLSENFTQSLLLRSDLVMSEPWRLFTSMFMHSLETPYHLFFNMLALLIFGPLLESKIGPRKFLMLYLTSGLMAGIAAAIFYPATLGASGAIMGMLGTLIILMPNLKLLLFFIIPMPLWVAGIIWAAMDIFGFLFATGDGIANAAHLAGLVTGLAYGILQTKGKTNFTKTNFKASSDDIILNKKHLSEKDVEEYLKKQDY